MGQSVHSRASKIADGAFAGLGLLAVLAYWAGLAALIWHFTPVGMLVRDLWELIPAGARGEVGVGLAIAGGVLLIGFVVLGFVVKDAPAPPRRRTGGGTSFDA